LPQLIAALYDMKFPRATQDLAIAKSEIEKMAKTTDFSEFQESWENYLLRLERSWESVNRGMKVVPGFEKFNRPYAQLRKKDQLLVFLKQARNAEMHSETLTVNTSVALTVKDRSGRGFMVNSVSSQLENGVLSINFDSPDLFWDVEVTPEPTDPRLSRIKNRSKWYNPPKMHLKVHIGNIHPVHIAKLGYTFYSAYIKEAEIWADVT
jgi:hypothetical protein